MGRMEWHGTGSLSAPGMGPDFMRSVSGDESADRPVRGAPPQPLCVVNRSRCMSAVMWQGCPLPACLPGQRILSGQAGSGQVNDDGTSPPCLATWLRPGVP